MTPNAALSALREFANPERAAQMRAYHKNDRPYLGLSNATTGGLAQTWRKALPAAALPELAEGLWQSNIFEARIAAGKLFIQARMKPDDVPAWDWIAAKVPEFDSWAIADAVAQGGQKRLLQDPSRLTVLEDWTRSDHLWTRRAAFVFALPFGKSRHPNASETAARAQIFTWCTRLASDHEWFIQKAVAWWLRDLSRRDPEAVATWLLNEGQALKPFARKEAARHLPKTA